MRTSRPTADTAQDALERIVSLVEAMLMKKLYGPRVLSITHAADYLDCSASHVKGLVRRGHIKAVDIGTGEGGGGKLPRITVEELRRFLELRRRAA